MGPEQFVPFTCEICGAQLGEQAVPVCSRCRRVVCRRHLRRGAGEDELTLCEICRSGPSAK